MNKFLNYLFITAFALSAVFTSCKKDDDKNGNGNGNGTSEVQLVKTITYYGYSIDFEYDDQNRIATSSYYMNGTLDGMATFVYNGDDLVKYVTGISVFDFSRNGNKITYTVTVEQEVVRSATIELNSDGYPIIHDGHPYQYQDGNLTTRYDGYSNMIFEYDNKKSPFYDCKTPKWFLVCVPFFEGYITPIKNNMTKITETRGETTTEYECTYEYNGAGFATKMYMDDKEHAKFTYK